MPHYTLTMSGTDTLIFMAGCIAVGILIGLFI